MHRRPQASEAVDEPCLHRVTQLVASLMIQVMFGLLTRTTGLPSSARQEKSPLATSGMQGMVQTAHGEMGARTKTIVPLRTSLPLTAEE